MAELNARTSSYIDLLLDLSGRARPSDFTAISADEATGLLQAYAAAHPEKSVVFDGHALVPLAAGPQASPQAEAAPVATPAATPEPEGWGEAPVPEGAYPAAEYGTPSYGLPDYGAPGPDLTAAEAGSYPPPGETPADADDRPLSELVPEVTPAYGAPQPMDQAAVYPQPSYAPSEPSGLEPAEQRSYPPPEQAVPAESGWDFSAPEQSDSDFFELPPSEPAASSEPVAWYWWLAVIFGSVPGAFLAWFVNRGRPGSRAFLFVGIALLVLALAIVALVWFLPGLLLSTQPLPTAP